MGATSLHYIEDTVLKEIVCPLVLIIFLSMIFNLCFTYKQSKAQQSS